MMVLEFLWERLLPLLPQLSILFAIWLIFYLVNKAIKAKINWQMPGNFAPENYPIALKVYLFLIMAIGAPTVEEIAFRLPLVIIFPTFNTYTWIMIILSSAIFACIHIEKKPATLQQKVTSNLLKVIFTFLFGAFLSYFGIKNQSVLLCLYIHVIWNTFLLLIAPSLIILLVILWQYLYVVLFPRRAELLVDARRLVEEFLEIAKEPAGSPFRAINITGRLRGLSDFLRENKINPKCFGSSYEEIRALTQKICQEEISPLITRVQEDISKLGINGVTTRYWYQSVDKILALAEMGSVDLKTHFGVSENWLLLHSRKGYLLDAKKELGELQTSTIDKLHNPAIRARAIRDCVEKGELLWGEVGITKEALDQLERRLIKEQTDYLMNKLRADSDDMNSWCQLEDLMGSAKAKPEDYGIDPDEIRKLRGYYGFSYVKSV